MAIGLIFLDIETENTGFDIHKDNKRILSLQLLDEEGYRIYCDDAETDGPELGKKDLLSLIGEGMEFGGFNIRRFDIPQIRNLWGIEIPPSKIIEISDLKGMDHIRLKLDNSYPTLDDSCRCLNIDCHHKDLLKKRADRIKEAIRGDPEIMKEAGFRIAYLQKNHPKYIGKPFDDCLEDVLKKKSGGMAILEAYYEYVQSGFDKSTDFHRYAVGDVIVEHELFIKLKQLVNDQ